MSRFEEAESSIVDKVQYIIRNKFPELNGVGLEIVMDTKKRKSGGKHILVKLDKSSPILRHISADNTNPDGVDYILYLDKSVYAEMSDDDRNRVISHGLYHADCDFEKEIPYGVRKPTVQTFYEEIADNSDDDRWAERLDLMAESIYDREDGE